MENRDRQQQTVYEASTLLIEDVLSDPATRENPEMIRAISGLIEILFRVN